MSKKPTLQVTAGRSDHVQKIVGILERMHNRYGPWEVFRKFLDLCHLCLDELPDNLDRALQKQPMIETDAYRKLADGLHERDIEAFAQCFGILLQASADSDGAPTYWDIIGSVYMTIGQGNKWAGQYFTPQNVADCMAQMTMHDSNIEAEFKRRLVDACADDPILKCLGLTAAICGSSGEMKSAADDWALTRFLPAVMRKIEPFRIADPAVGSGVMLLSAARACPRWLIDIGFVQFFGMDIDATCVSMCRLNMRLYGIEKVKLSDASIEALFQAPPPYDELYESVRAAKENGDTAAVERALEVVNIARQGTLEFTETFA